MIDTLKSCPFCGGTSLEVVDNNEMGGVKYGDVGYNYNIRYTVVCCATEKGCGATAGYWETRAKAIKKWNRRADNAEIHGCGFVKIRD